MESHRRAALWRTKIKNFGREWWRVFIVVFTLAVGIPSLYSYSTRVSVVPFSTLRSHEALGTVFNVTNGGIFDLHNVTQECDLVSLKDANNNAFGDNRFNPIGAHLSDLPAGATKSLSCEKVVVGYQGGGRIEIAIAFNSRLWPLRRIKRFPFQSEQADDGTWVWKAR